MRLRGAALLLHVCHLSAEKKKPHDTRDQIVDFVPALKTEIGAEQFIE